MIGMGKYKVEIDHMFFKGEAVFEIEFENDNYEFDIEIENADFDMDVTITEFEEDDDTLDAKATVAILPGKEIDIHLTFDEDGCNGYLKIPFVGKIKIKDAIRI